MHNMILIRRLFQHAIESKYVYTPLRHHAVLTIAQIHRGHGRFSECWDFVRNSSQCFWSCAMDRIYLSVCSTPKESQVSWSVYSPRTSIWTQGSFTGITFEEILDDPQLGSKRRELVESKARQLADARMINHNRDQGTFSITDLGRIAAKYYIRMSTIEVFNDNFRPKMGEADVLAMLCKSTEVSNAPFDKYRI